MPLLVPPAPAPALLSVLAALSSPTAVLEARTPALRTAEGPLDAERPLPVHVFEPASVPGGLPQARLVGWRFHIRAGARVAAAGETVATPDGWVFSRFSEGPYLVSTERALRQADGLPATYQPHLLSVPGRYMLALWLHADPRADAATAQPDPADLIIPLAPAPPGIAAHRVHRMVELAPPCSQPPVRGRRLFLVSITCVKPLRIASRRENTGTGRTTNGGTELNQHDGATSRISHHSQRKTPTTMCQHQPQCPAAHCADREAAHTVAHHPEQGWSLLCNGVLLFEDTGEILPDGQIIAPHRPLGTERISTAA